MPRIATLAFAALIIGAAPVRAQQNASSDSARLPGESFSAWETGRRVQVSAPALSDGAITGTLVTFGRDSLVLRSSSGAATITMPASEVTRLLLSDGHSRPSWAVSGGVIGLLAGGVLGTTVGDDQVARLAGFVAGVIIGAPLGAATGAIAAPEHWSLAARPDSTRAGGPFRLAIANGAEVRFAMRGDTGVTIRGESGGVEHDTLAIVPHGSATLRLVPLSDLHRLEVPGGRDKPRGMLLGAGIAGGATVLLAGSDLAKHNISAGDALGTVAANAVVGALVGYLFAPRGWEQLPLPHH